MDKMERMLLVKAIREARDAAFEEKGLMPRGGSSRMRKVAQRSLVGVDEYFSKPMTGKQRKRARQADKVAGYLANRREGGNFSGARGQGWGGKVAPKRTGGYR